MLRVMRVKIFLYVCAILSITALIACYNKSLSQVDDLQKVNVVCQEQEENLSTQLQVISDYKLGLEKLLRIEKDEHQQSKTIWEQKLNEEKLRFEKTNNEAQIKFNSLQQHYKLLQTQHDDFKEEASKVQQKQLSVINDLQSKLKEVQEQVKKIEGVKENLKSQILELQMMKENMESQLKGTNDEKTQNESKVNHVLMVNQQLQRQIDALKENCDKELENAANQDAPILFKPEPSSTAKTIPKKPENNELKLQDMNVLAKPNNKRASGSSTTSTTTASGILRAISVGKLNNARPLLLPTVTPSSTKKTISAEFENDKVPEGVVPVPAEQNPVEISNNRYQDKINKADDVDKDNGAREVFGGNAYDTGLVFGGDKNEPQEKQHIDALRVDDHDAKHQDYKDVQNNDIPLEEPDEDDDPDVYDNLRKDPPAIRN